MNLTIIDGGAHPSLASLIAGALEVPLWQRVAGRFPDGEAQIEIREPVLGHDVFIVQPTGPRPDEHLVELLLLADAAKRLGAARITAVMPYFGYARQDHDEGRPIAASLMARAIELAGVDQVVVLDVHSRTVETSFEVPVRHLSAMPSLAERLKGIVPREAVVVAPDLGAVKLADRYARALELPVAFVRKERVSGLDVEVHGVTGDVRGRALVVVDDMISTAGTIVAAARACIDSGARAELYVAATHGLFVERSSERLRALPLKALLTSDSLPAPEVAPSLLERLPVAEVLASEIANLHGSEGPPAEEGNRRQRTHRAR
jgi:ribose-phosphate pyrophosphokinase